MKASFVYITAGSMDEAKAVAQELVSKRLVACVNILENMRSTYWWEGEIQEDREVVLIAKTRESLVPRLTDQVKSLHSYDCPCIVSWPIAEGNKAFLDWIIEETREES